MNLLEFSHQFNQMLNSFLLIFAFSGEGHYGALVRPRVCSLNRLLVLALLPLEVTVISEVKPLASLTN